MRHCRSVAALDCFASAERFGNPAVRGGRLQFLPPLALLGYRRRANFCRFDSADMPASASALRQALKPITISKPLAVPIK